jgi:hypothetical protein
MIRELHRDVLLPLVVLMAIVVLTTAGTIALLARMAPAIDRIIGENLYSLEATEEMLAVAASAGTVEERWPRFDAALVRAESNVTEASERPHLAVLRRKGRAALSGDLEARAAVVAALSDLSDVNRGAVVRRDEEARRLGYAGAWAAVFLGAVSFAWGLLAVSRARRRVIEPLHEVGSVLDAARAGDRYRRCRKLPAPIELDRILDGVDDLLDARTLRQFAEEPSLRALVDRPVLTFLLEQRPGPAWVVTADGAIDAANRAGLERLAGDDGAELRQQLAAVVAGGDPGDLRVELIAGAERWLCELPDEESAASR